MTQCQYENFELRLRAANETGLYHVQVTASPQGELPSPLAVSIPVGEVAFPLPGQDLVALGQRLWAWLFPPPVEALYRAALAGLPPDGGLRLRLRVDPPELAALPWELAYDPLRGRFPALSARTPLVRYLALPFRPTPLSVSGAGPSPLRVLFVGSSPHDLPELDTSAEKELLLAALADLGDQGRVVVDTLPGRATVEALQDALRGGYRVLHFSGHGQAGALLLEDEAGLARPVAADALALLLGDSGVGLAVLNACDTGAEPGGPFVGVAPALVRAGLPAVAAMQAPLPEGSAKRFSRTLYAALADGWPLDAAVTEGRKALALSVGMDQPDWATPVLYLRAPDGVLWEFEEKEKQSVDDSGDVYENISISGGVVGAIGGRGHRLEQHVTPQGTVVSASDERGRPPGPDPVPISIDPDDPPLAAIRALLEAAFTESSLRRFCQNRPAFRGLLTRFSASDGLSDLVDEALEYCGQYLLWDELLAEIARVNPRQYVRHAHRLRGTTAATGPSPSLGALRRRLNRAFDDPGLDAFCLDHFPQVYDRFGRGMRQDEKITLLLDHCRRDPARYRRLLAALEGQGA